MKKLSNKCIFATSFLLVTTFALPSVGSAKVPPRRAYKKAEIKQGKAIRKGFRQGQVTRREARKLRKQQLNIQRNKRRMIRNDGRVGRRERRMLRRQQKRANRSIWKARHNRRHR